MREIKFRQWMSMRKTPTMFYDIGIMKEGHFIGPPSVNFSIDPLMQFTGLSDKNGKEIFEGDIVREEDKQELIFTIEIHPLRLIFVHKRGSRYAADERSIKNCEVIGNIYESPELLKDKK
jgi:uncharacterized phage protein (TIGR01671 family)